MPTSSMEMFSEVSMFLLFSMRNVLNHIWNVMEKPLAFDPRGRVALTPSGEIVLTLLGEIKMPSPGDPLFFLPVQY